IVHLRKVADRQRTVRDDAEERNRRHEQTRRDGASNENFREMHGAALLASGGRAALTTLAARAPAATAAALPAALIGRHSRSIFETQLTFRHDDFTSLQTLVDDDVLVDALRLNDRPLLDGGIGLDDEHVLTVLAGL